MTYYLVSNKHGADNYLNYEPAWVIYYIRKKHGFFASKDEERTDRSRAGKTDLRT